MVGSNTQGVQSPVIEDYEDSDGGEWDAGQGYTDGAGGIGGDTAAREEEEPHEQEQFTASPIRHPGPLGDRVHRSDRTVRFRRHHRQNRERYHPGVPRPRYRERLHAGFVQPRPQIQSGQFRQPFSGTHFGTRGAYGTRQQVYPPSGRRAPFFHGRGSRAVREYSGSGQMVRGQGRHYSGRFDRVHVCRQSRICPGRLWQRNDGLRYRGQ